MTTPRLDPERIRAFLRKEYTWDEIGRRLAEEHRRRVPYSGRAIITAYNCARRIDETRENLVWQLRAHELADPLGR